MDKKLVVVVGPTASGKSELAIKLAKKFNGEVISADSRQIYRGMDIGTGKVTEKEMEGVPHHLLDVASPKRRFTVVKYRKLATEAINKIFEKEKIPILCGGTGFYIQAVVDRIAIPEVPPDWQLREKLNKKSSQTLYQILKKLDPKRAGNIESKNKRRLIRAIEIVIKTKRPIPPVKKKSLPYPVLMIGIKKSPAQLRKLIKIRLLKRLKKGMAAEVKKLHQAGVSWKRLDELGLEYRWVARYLQKKIPYDEMLEALQKDIEKFAKRQITWFSRHWSGSRQRSGKRDRRIHWVSHYKPAEKLVKKFSRAAKF